MHYISSVDFRFCGYFSNYWEEGTRYRTQIKMQLKKQHAEMLARKEEEERKGGIISRYLNSHVVLMFQLASLSVILMFLMMY